MTSADQDAWVAIAEQIRTKLAEQVSLIPAMKPDEVKGFIETVQSAYWLHQNAALWDKEIELKQARVTAAD